MICVEISRLNIEIIFDKFSTIYTVGFGELPIMYLAIWAKVLVSNGDISKTKVTLYHQNHTILSYPDSVNLCLYMDGKVRDSLSKHSTLRGLPNLFKTHYFTEQTLQSPPSWDTLLLN